MNEMARPYGRALHARRIEGLLLVDGRSAHGIAATNVAAHYFADSEIIYSDKVAKFILECDTTLGGAVMRRLKARFGHIYVDEVQDMAGYDLDLLERFMDSGIRVTLVGDHRQATFRTNYGAKNSKYVGAKVVDLFKRWSKKKKLVLTYEQHTYRCHQHIADLSDSFYPAEPKTTSLNATTTEHDGVFTVPVAKIAEYAQTYQPQALRYDRRTPCQELAAKNFGESKGMTFERTLIFPNGPINRWLATGDAAHIAKTVAKLYVGVTRARQSVAFVFDNKASVPGIQQY